MTVSWLRVHVSSTLVEVESGSGGGGRLPRQYPGCLGWGIDTASSLLNMSTTLDMLGLSSACSCTHNSPTCMHLITSLAEYDSPAAESITSSALPSLYNFHACSILFYLLLHCILLDCIWDQVGDIYIYLHMQED